jgi:hypothetical protein
MPNFSGSLGSLSNRREGPRQTPVQSDAGLNPYERYYVPNPSVTDRDGLRFWFVLVRREVNIIAENDSPEAKTMAVAALKTKPELKTFHATLLVTRAEEWCVEAESAEEARELLAAGQGYRCHLGDRFHIEVEQVDE